MPWDLRRSQSGDIEFGPSYDFGIIAGAALIKQRIIVRLEIVRGWIYDSTGTLGSRLNISLAEPITEGIDSIPGLILEALDPMLTEIAVDDIQIEQHGATTVKAIIT